MTPAGAAAELSGAAVTRTRRLSGDVHLADLADGTAVVVKRHREPGWARAEAASLTWLAVPGGPPVPGVRGHRDGWLVLDHVPPGRPSERAAEDFGHALAVLHTAGAPAFGAPPPGGPRDASVGLAAMRDVPGEDWPSWYAEHRVLFYVRTARDAGVLTAAEARVFEDACDRIAGSAGPPEPPARLHGDLWSGNVHWAADGRAWLIDPSAHGGHRETDLAMLRLFGCPHLERVLAAYHERARLAPGWRERVPLHQLFPLLVHVVLFGRGYVAEALAAARAVSRPSCR